MTVWPVPPAGGGGSTRHVGREPLPRRPVMLAIAGDSAAGKTTLARGLVEALGTRRCVSLCTDDYHRHDRSERAGLPFTALHPDGNHVAIMEQHLQLLATGAPVLKPVYDHATGTLTRPELVEPAGYVIAEGLLPLHSRLSRACFDVTVYLDPPESLRRAWKLARDTGERGYAATSVQAELDRREPDSRAHVRPQRRNADLVVRFAPGAAPGGPLGAAILMRHTIDHPDLAGVLRSVPSRAVHLELGRDDDGRPAQSLQVHGDIAREESLAVQDAIRAAFGAPGRALPDGLGRVGDTRSEPLAITQLLLLHHLLERGR